MKMTVHTIHIKLNAFIGANSYLQLSVASLRLDQ